MLESHYVHPNPSKPPPTPVRVSCRSQLIAALRQRARPIVIEDQELARPFARLLLARELQSLASAEYRHRYDFESDPRSFGTDIEAQWHMGRYVAAGECAEGDSETKTATLAGPNSMKYPVRATPPTKVYL